ncbi:uncharacterized protein LOC105018268 isoform X2 [Esox lucius]|uniref:uncharacterized protein LOC105018268 isoform X2 n=1 Tax=Esox lucius TaxID=8010 RepID=UPI000576ED55|nr:uncharacterized protein LOC105018268 isoform X2 [Esox lucius]
MIANMQLPLITILLFKSCLCLQIDTVIQFLRSGVFGKVETVEQVLVNGAPLSSCGKDVSSILNAVLLINYNESFQTIEESGNNTMKISHTYMRVRECKLDSFGVLLLTDRLLVDGNNFLTLDRATDTWTAEGPQALPLKHLWDRESTRTRREIMQLHESCTKLLEEITCSEPGATGGMDIPTALAPLLAGLGFVILVIASFLISKKQDPTISGHPGGVIGSIIHYPHNISELSHSPNPGRGYQVL